MKNRETFHNIQVQQKMQDPTYEPVKTANQISLRDFATTILHLLVLVVIKKMYDSSCYYS